MSKITVFGPNKGPFDKQMYKAELIKAQGELCPVTMEPIDIDESDVIYNYYNDRDWIVSTYGIMKLRDMYGADFIDSRIVDRVISSD